MVIACPVLKPLGNAKTQRIRPASEANPSTSFPERSRNQAAESLGSSRLICFFAFAVLLAAAFGHPLASLAKYAAATDLHSHILLIPFISAYLILSGASNSQESMYFLRDGSRFCLSEDSRHCSSSQAC